MKKNLFIGISLVVFFSNSIFPQATISGTINLSGQPLLNVVMSGLPGNPLTDAAGFYTATVASGWSGTVTPILAGYAFTPNHTDYANVTSDQATDYTATRQYFSKESYVIPPELTPGSNNLVFIDFNHDGFLDILMPQTTNEINNPTRIVAYRNDGAGHFDEVTNEVLGNMTILGCAIPVAADFNGDGLCDLFIADGGIDIPPYNGQKYVLLMQQVNGTLVDEAATHLPPAVPNLVPSVSVGADIENDGDIDILVTGTGGGCYLLINDGGGHFVFNVSRLPTGLSFTCCQSIDYDKDGAVDFFLSDGTIARRYALLHNNGQGHFMLASESALPPVYGGSEWYTGWSLVGDLNADGWLDIILRCSPNHETNFLLQVLLNNSDGTFRDASNQVSGNEDIATAAFQHGIADFNGDGWPDILMRDGSSGVILVYINTGDAHFESVSPTLFASLSTPPVCIISETGDIDNDGDFDFITVTSDAADWHVYRNESPYDAGTSPRPLPAAPTLQTPADGVSVTTMSIPLDWQDVDTALLFQVQVALDSGFSQIFVDQDNLMFHAFTLGGLSGSTTYYWRVRAINTRGIGPWSSTWRFTTPSTFTVSGQANYQGSGFACVRMMGLPGNPLTDSSGNYSAEVEAGWSGIVTPLKDSYNFDPGFTEYSEISTDRSFNYLAYQGISVKERQALIALYNANNGDSWVNRGGWKDAPLEADGFGGHGSEGNWYGVTVTNPFGGEGIVEINPYVTGINESGNTMSGPLPSAIGDLAQLQGLRLEGGLTGPLPNSMSNLIQLSALDLRNNNLTGNIPAFLGDLTRLTNLQLHQNMFTGPIPEDLGNCTNLFILFLSDNGLAGPLPGSLSNLTKLSETGCHRNGLYTEDPALKVFMDEKFPGWSTTQTVAPTDVSAVAQSTHSILVSWTPIVYTGGSGGYRVFYGTASGGPYTLFGQTTDKTASSLPVTGLNPGTPYYFTVQTRTDAEPPGGSQKNTVDSEYSSEVTATTLIEEIVSAPTTPTGPATGTVGDLQHGP